MCIFLAVALPAIGTRAQGTASAAKYDRLHAATFSGSKTFSSNEILQASGLKLESPTTQQDLQNAANRLSQLGTFSSVRYSFQTTDEGLEVQFQLADEPEYPASFDNFPWVTDAEISAAIKQAGVLYNGSAPEHGAILDSISAAIENLLVLHSVKATVEHSLLHDPITDRPTEQFRAEGAQVTIAGVEFSDSLAQKDPAIAQALQDLIDKPYSRDTIELFESQQVVPVYLAHAYLEVRFPQVKPKLTDASGKISANEVMVGAPVEAGSAFTWDGVSWSGTEAISAAALDRLVPFKPGDAADGTKIQSLWNDVAAAYGHIGYLDAAVTPLPHFDESTKKVSFSVSVAEGPQYHMGDLVLSGLSIVGEKQIRDAWKIPPGAVFDETFYNRFLATGIAQAFAGLPMHYEKIGHYLEKDSQTAKANVMLDFE